MKDEGRVIRTKIIPEGTLRANSLSCNICTTTKPFVLGRRGKTL